MQRAEGTPLTPLFLKTGEHDPWPGDDGVFYVLGSNGLFLCRNQPFFRSSVPARAWPAELHDHETFLSLTFPPIPRRAFERVVGFFGRLADLHGAEGAVLLVWDRTSSSLRMVVPGQTSRVEVSSGGWRAGVGVDYEIDPEEIAGALVVGDIHSHVYAHAYSSGTDRHDETHRPGLHLVVGRLDREPPEFHAEFVVDGTRFEIDPAQVVGGYAARRRDFPVEWMERVRIASRNGRPEFRGAASDRGGDPGNGRGLIGPGDEGSDHREHR